MLEFAHAWGAGWLEYDETGGCPAEPAAEYGAGLPSELR